ncbi:hypothetical protein [Taklimakanibacter albus]|uniref:Uncharacterized protein n=1 Tax=Taklimakanibacter albus TaxID=2800327 RepID=A0ACC5RG40_9HYPH|nr:hypothetical protein [Aestuariivirga sp. YIM B02566]MBK1871563.1 hypothetical protein [Aestuariivirga sp. YIM B02566]
MPRDLTRWPDIPQGLVEHLQKLYPPRCKRRDESLEEHMHYAGKAELTEQLAREMATQRSAAHELDEPEDEEDYPD